MLNIIDSDDNATVKTSNCTTIVQSPSPLATPTSLVAAAQHVFGKQTSEYLNAISIATTHAIADTGATSIFIMDGVDVVNKRPAPHPLTINLPDGRKVKSSHVCDITIPGLPLILTGHVVPHLAIASLIGIRPLCDAGCTVTFDKEKCNVVYEGNVILRGFKDIATGLWTLPIDATKSALPRSAPDIDRAQDNIDIHPGVHLPSFTHSVSTRANGVKFAHQLLCNPKILTLLKAVRRGFLKGCPNFSEKLILKYLNPSPATAKGHMKRPRHGIRSTHRDATTTPIIPATMQAPATTSILPAPIQAPNAATLPIVPILDIPPNPWMQLPADIAHLHPGPAIIADDEESIANVFCYGAFADRHSGVVYNDLTGNFPFVSFDGSVCFLVMYHYEANAIMATPIAGLDNRSIFTAYKKNFKELTAKGFKPKLNVMDNQATKQINFFLTEEECKLQLVEPHNHRVNAAERAIQTFKDAFISALATTDRDFPLQLWDKITPQVITTLNMMRASCIDPTKSAHEILYGPYDWNRYPLAPLGCKAMVYEDGDTRGSWASRGVDGWYLGPSLDHYRCDIYYIPETRGYRVSGSTELFPQHCQLPDMTPHQHFRALTDELSSDADRACTTTRGRRALQFLQDRITVLLQPLPTPDQQRVSDELVREAQQRVIDDSPILTVPRITDAPGIMESRNPTAKRALRDTPRLHRRVTRNNTPGIVADPVAPQSYLPAPNNARQRIVTRHAINALTTSEQDNCQKAFTPIALLPSAVTDEPAHLYEHFVNPMVHPVTGETISSYKKLMHDPATAEIWQTAFGKDFGGMAQGGDKTGQKGTNAMYVMSHKAIKRALENKKKFTYGNPVVDYRPQKDDPHCIRITAGGNLITY